MFTAFWNRKNAEIPSNSENSKKCYFSRFIAQKRYQQIFYKPLSVKDNIEIIFRSMKKKLGVSELLFEIIEDYCQKSTFLVENDSFFRLAKKLNLQFFCKPLNIKILMPLKNQKKKNEVWRSRFWMQGIGSFHIFHFLYFWGDFSFGSISEYRKSIKLHLIFKIS